MKAHIGESEVVDVGLELRRLLVLLERLPDWHFDRLEHDSQASGLWSARVTFHGANREHVRAYGGTPDTALAQLTAKLADRYQVPA